jgi:hypothetical protein
MCMFKPHNLIMYNNALTSSYNQYQHKYANKIHNLKVIVHNNLKI